MTSSEYRASFLQYFERHGHRVVASAPLVPHGDTTLLFTNAGMNQFKDVFLGRETRDYSRAATAQKCMRVSGKHNDLDNVGPSFRHHTFFEMLGNFSFGDYFKHDAIALAWELLTREWGLPAERLLVTIFKGEGGVPRDDEAHARWRDFVPAERIAELGSDDNFWSMGETGPCGRCSEIHFFRGDHLPCRAPQCLGPACDCERYVEIWNNVFMEFDRQADGTLKPLPRPSIDTGLGLERLTAIGRRTLSTYDTDVFEPLLLAIAGEAGLPADPGRLATAEASEAVSSRVVADHARAMTFLIADGVMPSNEWRGYVLRKIMRRAMRHGKRLGISRPFLHRLVPVLVDQMGHAYPELGAGRETIVQAIRAEEERFDAVLTSGLPRLEELIERATVSGTVPGAEAFRLYDTYGLPLDFIEDLAGERKLAFDRAGFDAAMEGQRQKARAGSAFDSRRAEEFRFRSPDEADRLRIAGDRFEGYTATSVSGAHVLALFDAAQQQVPELAPGAAGFVVLDRTPFYLEAGGQVSDTGRLRDETGATAAEVRGVTRTGAGLPRAHRVAVLAGPLVEGQRLEAVVDNASRDATRRNHTATHLLHAALRRVLGGHVKQAGSLVAPDRLRFDFTHPAPVTDAEIAEIERLVNEHIVRNADVTTEVRNTEEAIAGGAMALFGEKYGDRVRVVTIPEVSTELCGGTHCRATGDIGLFAVVQEGGVAAGVRRIEAVTGMGALAEFQRRRMTLRRLLATLNVSEAQAPEALARLQAESRRLAREVQELKVKAALGAGAGNGGAADDTVDIGGVSAVFRAVIGMDKNMLRELADSLKRRLKSGVVVLASTTPDEKVAIVAAATPDLKGRVHAGTIVKTLAPMVGGGGGGRPDFAEAGGRDPSKIDHMLAEGRTLVEEMLRQQPRG